MPWNLEQIMRASRKFFASDIHLIRGISPALRVGGEIRLVDGEPLDEETLRSMVSQLLTARQAQIFEQEWQVCISRHWPEVGRFRASVYFHGGCPEMSIRLCEQTIRSREELGLPAVVDELTRLTDGLILVTGPTGMGKTTTLNYMVDVINRDRRCKIITIEDPVEFMHDNVRSIVVQQEVYTDTPSFKHALIHVLRQDPDVIVVGEMRDIDTMATALMAAETGHLVLATLHTPDAVQSIQRIYGVFPPEQQNQIRYQLSNCLQAILAQNLLPRADGRERIMATEVAIATPAIRKHIRDGFPHLLVSEIQMGRKFKMQSMDAQLLELYQKGIITFDTALSNARDQQIIRKRSGDSDTNEN